MSAHYGPGVYFDDVEIGTTYRTAKRTISFEDIRKFGELTGDMTPLHVDEEYSRNGPFGRPVAHGAFGAALINGLKAQQHLYDRTSIAALGWDRLRYVAPIFVGDTIHAEVKYLAKRLSRSNPDRGIVTEEVRLLNQKGAVVTQGEFSIMLLKNDSRASAKQ